VDQQWETLVRRHQRTHPEDRAGATVG
jgi:hypothetical protein